MNALWAGDESRLISGMRCLSPREGTASSVKLREQTCLSSDSTALLREAHKIRRPLSILLMSHAT